MADASVTTTATFSVSAATDVCNSFVASASEHGPVKVAQTFVLSEYGLWTLDSVAMNIGRYLSSGEPQAGTLTLEVRQDSETGTLLGLATMNRLSVTQTSSSSNYETFAFVGDIQLSSGSTYCLVLYDSAGYRNTDAGTYDDIRWWYNGTNPYAGGSERRYYDTTWTTNSGVDVRVAVYGNIAAAYPVDDPTPSSGATGVDFSEFLLEWNDVYNFDPTYDVYVGLQGDETLVASNLDGSSHQTSLSELEEIFESSPIDQEIYWYLVSHQGGYEATSDEWNFDPRPAKPVNPTPGNAATGQRLNLESLLWEAG